MKTISICLIDPSRLVRESIAMVLEQDFAVTATLQSINDLTKDHRADIYLIDAAIANEEGAIRRIVSMIPDARVVVFSSTYTTQQIITAVEAGAHGCLSRSISPEALSQSLRLVMLDQKVFPSDMVQRAFSSSAVGANATDMSRERPLTTREVQILQGLLNGDQNKQIAQALGITEATVKVHLKALLRKIKVANRTQAAIWAASNGIPKAKAA
jgi:two-component system, NarL family, nitrate/nitrite response regulator NarL